MNAKQQEIWLKAAVIGSVWASFEIVFGSFFHSLRLPFAGTFLSFSAMVLLITFSYKWNDKNLFLKAGLIAALMRSLMPTSVILGPLIGIMLEAVLFQIIINIFKRNYFSFALAGTLAMFSAILHKVVSIILIYGFDIVKILENLYFVLLKTTHINLPVNQLLLIVVFAYTFFGFLSAFLGVKIGKSIDDLPVNSISVNEKWEVKNTLFDIKHFKYHSKYIVIHMSALITFLFALEIYAVQYVLPPVVIYLFWLIKRYGKSLRRLAKPLFWVQLIIILALAVLLWQNRTEGLIVGIKMIVRAVLVVTIFTAISVELKNPLVKALLYKRGYSQLYATLGLATSAVPFILKNLAVSKKDFFNPFKILRKSVGLSDILFSEFKEHLNSKNTIYIISGETRSGKTTFLKQIISELKQAKNYKINGIIAHGIDRNNERFGFEIENIATEQKQILCTQKSVENAKKIGRFYFNNLGLSFGKKALLDNIDTADLLVIDEIGYMELKGKGWFSVIEQAMDYPDLDMIWVVRKRILEEVLQLWQHSNIKVIDINIHKSATITKQLLKNNKYDNR